jgi:MFS family permease
LNPRDLRLLFLVAGAIVFVDTMFYAAVVPLLPTLTRELHLSKASAGVLTAAYAAGTLVGSIPGGMLAAGAGPRTTIYAGLFLMGVSSLAFGFLDNIVLLDLARFVQGFGSAFTWAGSLAWLIGEVPAERRGSTIGGALSAAIGGALFGPVIGTLAHALGRAPVFGAVVVVAVALAAAVTLLPAPSPPPPQPGAARLLQEFARPAIVLGMWLVALPALASGTLNVLAPLRMSALGAGAAGIGATFLIAAAAEATISPAVGHVSDQRGRMYPLRIGLAAAAIVLACFTLSESVLAVAAVVVLGAVALGAFWAPAMAMLSDAAESDGISLGYAMALINLAWAAGQVAGAAGGGAIAKATSDGVPFVLVSGLCVVTLGLVLLRPVRVALAR